MRNTCERALYPSTHEQLLAKWIAVTDQPFSVVEEPGFKTLLNYVHHHSARILALPSAETIQWSLFGRSETRFTC
jgi:hypothetical protein